MAQTTTTVCSYCGVGCDFEVNNNKLMGLQYCSKGISQTKTINTNRLLNVKKRFSITDEFKASTYEESIKFIANKIKVTDPNKIGFYLSGQMLNEDYYVANKLAKGFIGTANCDTNSRTCMASAVVGYKKSFGVDFVPLRMKDIDKANLLILIGSNSAEAHVVLHNQIKKAKKNGLKVVVIDPRETLTSKVADLYIPIKAGTDIDLLNLISIYLIQNNNLDKTFIENHTNDFESYKKQILKLNKDELLKNANISQDLFENFYKLIINSKNIITAWTMGVNQSIQGVDKNLAINNFHILTGQINKEGSGPLSLTGQPNAMGGREVGGLSTTLAVHLDYSEKNCDTVRSFWNAPNLVTRSGLTSFEIIEQANKGKVDILIICHTDPVYHLPNRHFVENAMKKISLVVELNAYENSITSNFVHIQIPTLPFGLKSGTQTNLDRTIQIVESFHSSNHILQDWQVFSNLAKELGYKKEFNYKSSEDIFNEYKNMTKLSKNSHLDIYKTNYKKLKTTHFVWGEDIFKNNSFMTNNNKANLYFVENKNLSEQPCDEYPFILLTGRTRDQWHSGSKTSFVNKLMKYKELEFIEMNQQDALKLNIIENEIVKISSKRGSIKAKVVFALINTKHVFIPITHKSINYLTSSNLDPLSKEPDYNHSAIKIEKIL